MNFSGIFKILFAVLSLGCGSAMAQLDQVGAIRNFSIPRFNEEGGRLWLLQGKELRRQSKEVAFITEMDLQTYDSERGVPETRLRSPFARFHMKNNLAGSDKAILINGPDYEISGQGWQWNGSLRRVLIASKVQVFFEAVLTDFLASECAPDEQEDPPAPPLAVRPVPDDAGQTRIYSDKLEMLTTDEGHRFFFLGNVRVFGRNLNVTCDRLEVTSKRSDDEDTGPGAFGSISSILALGHVRIEQSARSAVAGKATIDVKAGTIALEEAPVIFDDKGKAEGHKIILYRGQRRAEVHGKPGETRAKVTLPPIGDLGVFGKEVEERKKDTSGSNSKTDEPSSRP